MSNCEKLSFDSELLQPLKERLELAINSSLRVANLTNKEVEINLKITLKTDTQREYEKGELTKKWEEPRLEFKLSEKVKENKFTNEGTLGFNYALEINEDTNEVYIRKANEQIRIEDLKKEEN